MSMMWLERMPEPGHHTPLLDAPQRHRAKTDSLSGPDIAYVLKQLDTPVEQFASLTGSYIPRVQEHLAGISDDNMPFYYQTALFGLHHCPELRTADVPLLPEISHLFTLPSVRLITVGSPGRAKSTLTGDMIAEGLENLYVPNERFRQLGGIAKKRFSKILRGEYDGDLPMFYELIFYVLDRCPRLRRWKPYSPANSADVSAGFRRVKLTPPVPLPFEAWGLEKPEPIYKIIPVSSKGRDPEDESE